MRGSRVPDTSCISTEAVEKVRFQLVFGRPILAFIVLVDHGCCALLPARPTSYQPAIKWEEQAFEVLHNRGEIRLDLYF